MQCPSCKNDMKSGFVRAMGNGGICWINEPVEYGAPRSADGFLPLGKSPYLKGECIPACRCEACKLILIDYSALA